MFCEVDRNKNPNLIELNKNDFKKETSDRNETLKKIKFEDISFVKCYSELSTLYMVTKDSISKQLNRNDDINKALESNNFLKINNDIMINPIHIKEIIDFKRRKIGMKCGTEFQVSRRKWHLVKYYLELT